MPLYEYECEKCGDVFEAIQKFSDAPLATHEKCGGSVHRKISAPALQFKGSGWYITDYAKNSGSTPTAAGENGAGTKKDSNASKEGGTASSSTSEAKSTTPSSSSPESKSSSPDKK